MQIDDEMVIEVTEFGKPGIQRVTLKGPEIAKLKKDQADFNRRNPNFWCKCGSQKTGAIIPRGHSVDVKCVCGGYIQVG